ncbi:MAG: ABC transporter ATP-binding protein [Thiobacillus sp.]
MPVIEVKHLTKEYRLGALQGIKQSLLNSAARLAGKRVKERPLFKALDDVSFSVDPGEVVGIIGHNGAGKSTLLKMLARISTPTSGSVKVNGRISPLIEVGAGFVPDFTGRENVYLNGAILGMSRGEIDRKFDEIVDFAEMAEFIDTPVKRYSSGMQVKLAFAVATSIESEILIVDEVLAVGDLAFQRKCFDRMEDLIKRQGRTVLLVSHNIRQVERLCTRVLLMSHGTLAQDGAPKDVCNLFYEASDKQIHETKISGLKGRSESSGDIALESVTILDASGKHSTSVEHLQDIEFKIKYRIKNALHDPIFGIGIHTTDFLYLATSQSIGELKPGTLSPGLYVLSYKVRRFPFLPGIYSLRLGVALGASFQPVYYSEGVIPVQVVSGNINRAVAGHSGEGFVSLDGIWAIETDHEMDEQSCSGERR